ncbi:hypothetical protein TCAL_15377 [Tigriopus californicus]|uniref:Uncharacterized protein n=1 Tax=Tigriopus californicus TaxID=6832 RepID=A0A553PLK4_TIGCA|nr:hypothetical protein TCAL_15377 [Tigriopus californicus]
MELGKLEGEVGQLSANLPVDLISPDVHRVVSGCLSSMSDDLTEMRASAQADLDGLPIPDVTLEAPSGDDDDSKKKKKDKDDTSGKSKSSFFGGLFKFKLPDFSGFKFEGKPSSVEVDKLMKDLPEPDDYAEEEQDWTLLFGRLRQGKTRRRWNMTC